MVGILGIEPSQSHDNGVTDRSLSLKVYIPILYLNRYCTNDIARTRTSIKRGIKYHVPVYYDTSSIQLSYLYH